MRNRPATAQSASAASRRPGTIMCVTGAAVVCDLGGRCMHVELALVLRTGNVIGARNLERGARRMVIADVLDELGKVIGQVDADDGI